MDLDPVRSSATLAYHLAKGTPAELLMRLADAVVRNGEGLEEVELPLWAAGEPVILHRHRDIISLLEIASSAGGRLLAYHPTIGRDPAIARRIADTLRVAPGVTEATTISAKSELRVRFNPRAVTASHLIRIVEAALFRADAPRADGAPGQVDFAPANVSLGIAATGEFVLPIVTPVTAGMLVLSNIETFRAAAHQARGGKFGLPVLYTSIVGVTLATGQFLSAALMFWFFRYWEHRYRRDFEVESQILVQAVSVPKEARVLRDNGEEYRAPSGELAVGQRVRALAGEVVAVDARVIGGAGLLDEAALRGTRTPVRRVTGDHVLAGSKLIAGALELEVLRSGEETDAARIGQSLLDVTAPTRRSWALNQEAEEFAGRAVAPTFLAAGIGLIVGDLTTAGAILRPDYATGVGLATPLETLRDIKLASRNGVVVRSGAAFGRLAKTSWILLEDHEALHHHSCDVAEIRGHRLGESRLLLAAAAAGVWLGDERGPALVRACQQRGLVVRRAELREIGVEGVIGEHRGHIVRLRGHPITDLGSPPPLILEFDGAEVAGIRFRRNGSLTAATTVRRLQRDGLRVFLISERAADATAGLASRLGVERHRGDMHLDDKIRLLRDLGKNGVAAVFVGDCVAGARAAQEAQLAIALGAGCSPGGVPWDVALLRPSIELLPTLFALSRDHTTRIERARHTVMAPNLLCVAGAFSFGLTGLAAVFISNFGTSIVYNNVMRSLRAVRDPVTEWRDACGFEDAATASDWPNSRLGEGHEMEMHHDQPAA
ncbi:MAG TPA: HAD family hydrolase [Stellaceae bacterium]|nr:HAD family hydrolase [Stellaceae bacterium]